VVREIRKNSVVYISRKLNSLKRRTTLSLTLVSQKYFSISYFWKILIAFISNFRLLLFEKKILVLMGKEEVSTSIEVSVVIPVKDGERYIEECLQSILKQENAPSMEVRIIYNICVS